jgi:MFS-type transporter involved in bile tolerance (Atg22 family)
MIAKEFQMTTYILIGMCALIIVMLGALLMRPAQIDMSGLREDNTRLRERLAERLG